MVSGEGSPRMRPRLEVAEPPTARCWLEADANCEDCISGFRLTS